jgi:hypothetical protein
MIYERYNFRELFFGATVLGVQFSQERKLFNAVQLCVTPITGAYTK